MPVDSHPSPQSFTLQFPVPAYEQMIGAAYEGYPLEACGLLVGESTRVHRFVACTNEAASARVYSVPGKELLHAERAAEADGLAVIGVFHSHTHSEPYPSPTDVEQAPDPDWFYVIVSLKRDAPEARCYRIVDGAISEVPISVG
jgi:[CysO sulfur-carrier protein]-S-L-cysteine hydrolase